MSPQQGWNLTTIKHFYIIKKIKFCCLVQLCNFFPFKKASPFLFYVLLHPFVLIITSPSPPSPCLLCGLGAGADDGDADPVEQARVGSNRIQKGRKILPSARRTGSALTVELADKNPPFLQIPAKPNQCLVSGGILVSLTSPR